MKYQKKSQAIFGRWRKFGYNNSNDTTANLLSGHNRSYSGSRSRFSNTSRISTHSVQMMLNKLLGHTNRDSTTNNYLTVWRQFNKFIISLDYKPPSWEERAALFLAFKIEVDGLKSTSVKSYLSAIKKLLIDDGYDWNNSKILLGSLTKACRLVNDRVHTRLPIQCSLLEMILFEIQRKFTNDGQMYLKSLYMALFTLSYYGLMRVGEVMLSDHVVKVANVHCATNKDKILVILYTSKTHNRGMRPQKIKNYLKYH